MTNEKNENLVRLNVFLQEHGLASRRKADEMIKCGRIRIDGQVVKEMGVKIDPKANVTLDGKRIAKAPSKAVYLFHKPDFTITSRLDEKERTTIFDLPNLKKLPKNVQSVGRLDFRSEGLLVLTNDGDLSLALSHPRFSVEKTYAVLVSTQATVEDLETLRKGVQLDDGLAKPISVSLGRKEKFGNSIGQWIEIVVTEGRNRLIRRMMEALGLHVVRLVRVAIGDVRLPPSLEAGALRPVTSAELEYLQQLKQSMQEQSRLKKSVSKKLPTPQELAVRRANRKNKLNDEAFERAKTQKKFAAEKIAEERKQKMDQLKK